MAENTLISWAHCTFNPWMGCTKVSPACANCYAERDMDHRYGKVKWGPQGNRVLTSDANWKKPIKWNKEAGEKGIRYRVFCASLADVFEDWNGPIVDSKGWPVHRGAPWHIDSDLVGIEGVWIGQSLATMQDVRKRLFELIDATPNLDWLLLTKRPENILKMWPSADVFAHAELEEIRLPIPDYPDYEVSNLGVVYTLRGSSICCFCGQPASGVNSQKRYCSSTCRQASHYKRKNGVKDKFTRTSNPLHGDIGEDGHTRVTLYRNGESARFLIHRLVLTLFDRPSDPSDQGRHLDGDPTNNCISNLAWGSQSQNWDDSKLHGTHRRYSKLTPEQVDGIRVASMEGEMPSALAIQHGVSVTQIRNILSGKQWKDNLVYRSNCWLGCSVENQEYAEKRIPELLKCRELSPVLWLSCEPLLGPLELDYPPSLFPDGPQMCCGGWECGCMGMPVDPPVWLGKFSKGIDWVIAGGESGPNARPSHPDWFRSLRDQCAASNVPFHFKQWGEWVTVSEVAGNGPHHQFEDGATVRRVGVKQAGRTIDGVVHDAFPIAS